MFKIAQFFFFNSVLPFTDVFTDGVTFKDLLDNDHLNWAYTTFYFMWNPFILHVTAFFYNLIQACWNYVEADFEDSAAAAEGWTAPLDRRFPRWKAELKETFLHIPFLLPVKNAINTYRLYQMGFGMKHFDQKNWRKVEKIQKEAGVKGMHESFEEAGPQAIVQLVTVFSTGHISTAQMISIPMSIISLAWASSRVFFIMRTPQESDPDPNLKLILLRILPWELLIVTNSIILWTTIGGLLGKYIFIGVLFSFCTILTALHFKQKRDARKQKVPDEEEQDNANFKVVAALTSLWPELIIVFFYADKISSHFFVTKSL